MITDSGLSLDVAGSAAGRKTDDEVHRARRPSLRARRVRQARHRGGSGGTGREMQ